MSLTKPLVIILRHLLSAVNSVSKHQMKIQISCFHLQIMTIRRNFSIIRTIILSHMNLWQMMKTTCILGVNFTLALFITDIRVT
jgi:hypothetical protein